GQDEDLLALVRRAEPPDADVADAGRVVLELAGAGLRPLELARYQDVREAAGRNAGPLPHPERDGAVEPADRRSEPLRVVRLAHLRSGFHRDAGPRALEAVDPGRRLHDLAVLDLLGVLADVPDGASVVLGEERELPFDEPTGAEVPLPDDDGADAADDL